MADWRQIKARVRKAKAAADPPAALENLYQRTRDAMVAMELGAVYEKAERREDAVKWFRTAFDRFRRGAWKRKAGEGLVRLGESVDLSAIPEDAPRAAKRPQASAAPATEVHFEETAIPLGDTEPDSLSSEPAPVGDLEAASVASVDSAGAGAESTAGASAAGKKRRRGRRGGRGRRRGKPAASAGATTTPLPPAAIPVPRAAAAAVSRVAQPTPPARPAPPPEPEVASFSGAVGTAYAERSGRAGDPGMASRMAKLEAQLRRLLACPEHSMDDLDNAPAGPGFSW